MEPLWTGYPGENPAPSAYWYGPYKGTLPLYGLVIDYGLRGSGLGEDAPPIWTFKQPSYGLIGVFDGLGGAGGETIKLTDGSLRTSAWLASRFARNCVIDIYQELIQRSMTPQASSSGNAYNQTTDFTAKLRHVLKQKLNVFATEIRAGSHDGRLRSRLIKVLPTTMAICSFDLSNNTFTAVWAGDSRIYSLRPSEGLQQVTTDDLKSSADALENLTQDSPMSNFVSADTDFVLHERRRTLQPFTILVAASDGCFAYMQTPLHFEHALLSTMQESMDWTGWQERLESRIVQITGDDSTLSAVAIGWPDFASCRVQYAARADWCSQRINAYDEDYDRVKHLERDLSQARKDLASSLWELWQEYRTTYESLALVPSRDVPQSVDPRNDADRADGNESP